MEDEAISSEPRCKSDSKSRKALHLLLGLGLWTLIGACGIALFSSIRKDYSPQPFLMIFGPFVGMYYGISFGSVICVLPFLSMFMVTFARRSWLLALITTVLWFLVGFLCFSTVAV